MGDKKTLAKYRKMAGYNQTELANDLGINQGTLSKWENRNDLIPLIYFLEMRRILEIKDIDEIDYIFTKKK